MQLYFRTSQILPTIRISQFGYGFGNGNIETAITSQGRPGSDALQALALLYFIKKGGIE